MIPFIVMVADLATLSTIRRETASTPFFCQRCKDEDWRGEERRKKQVHSNRQADHRI